MGIDTVNLDFWFKNIRIAVSIKCTSSKLLFIVCEIWGSRNGKDQDYSLWGCDIVW